MGRWAAVAASCLAYGPTATVTAGRAKRRGAKQKLQEFAGLVQMVRRERPRAVLEIGTFHGGSMWAWCRVAAPDATIVSVDLPGGEFGGGYDEATADRLRGYARPGQTLHLLRADSHSPETLADVARLLPSVDFALIDGDHTYEGVKQDVEMYAPLVAPGGLVALHDTLQHRSNTICGVDRLWRELAPHFETVTFEDPGDESWNGVWGGIGVLRVDHWSRIPAA